jgi:hypothetical protein
MAPRRLTPTIFTFFGQRVKDQWARIIIAPFRRSSCCRLQSPAVKGTPKSAHYRAPKSAPLS